jgi:hypothetical protein
MTHFRESAFSLDRSIIVNYKKACENMNKLPSRRLWLIVMDFLEG